MAIAQLPSVKQRVELLLWHLADRWGRVAADGVVLALELEQETVGNLVGASRSRVNAALSALAHDDRLRQLPEGWLLCAERPRPLLASAGCTEIAGADAVARGWPHRRI